MTPPTDPDPPPPGDPLGSRPAAVRRRPLVDPVCEHPSRGDLDAMLAAAGQGDREAFAAFYDRTVPVVFGLLRGVLGRPGHAERATEVVYLQLWRAAPGFDPATRSAYATVLFLTRRALTGPVHGLLRAPAPGNAAEDTAPRGSTAP